MTANDRKVLDRIRKVLAKAEGTDNAAEADMLMAKVHAMLQEHNLELLDLETAGSDDPIGTSHDVAHTWASSSWATHVAAQLATYYGCRLVTDQWKNKILFSVSGRESARITWELMLPYVLKQVRYQARLLMETRPDYTKSRAERHVGNALTFRILKLVRESQQAEEQRVARGERALVPVDLVEAEMHRAHPNLRSSRKSRISSTAAAREAASRISLHRQTGGAKVKVLQ